MFKFIKGKVPLLLIAPHVYSHNRDGKLKLGDRGTGYITRQIQKKINGYALISNVVQDDPNWYQDSPFRKKVFEIVKNHSIKLVVDIHGSQDIDDNNYVFITNQQFDKFYKNILSGVVIKPFKPNNQITISENLDKIKIPCVEIEIRKRARYPYRGNQLTSLVINQLVQKLSEVKFI